MKMSAAYWLLIFTLPGFGFQEEKESPASDLPEAVVSTVMTSTSNGKVLRRNEAFYWQGKDAEVFDPLPILEGDFQAVQLKNFTGPALLAVEFFAWLDNGAWVIVPSQARLERLAPRQRLGSFYGAKLLYPEIASLPDGTKWLYQADAGTLAIYSSAGNSLSTSKVTKDMRPLLVEGRLLWLNGPDEGIVGLNGKSSRFQIADQIAVENLSKYSPAFLVKGGAWVFTFSMGLRDSLKAWSAGDIETHANFLSIQGGKIANRRHLLGSMPLSFALTIRPSGSPKLDVSGNFQGASVMGARSGTAGHDETDELAVLADGELLIISPSKGIVHREQTVPGTTMKWVEKSGGEYRPLVD